MFKANSNFALMPDSYLFSEVARRIRTFKESHPDSDVIRMDIGDVSLPLPEVAVRAMQDAAAEMGTSAGFHGYGPEQGYPFLRELIAANDYQARGIDAIEADDIFISDGAKSDVGNLGDLFGSDLRIAVADPAYPVYVDANVIDGRAGTLRDGHWSRLVYLQCPPSDDFRPQLPAEEVDVIYLCYPNNPTGAALTADRLRLWVEYAREHGALIIYDSAYEAYVRRPGIARSIYEVEGAEKVAIEVRSFSKTAGFTGVRCGYTVVPRALEFRCDNGLPASLNKMWCRRQSTKFNGVGYVVQKAAASLYTPEGRQAVERNVDYYMRNARSLRDALTAKGLHVVGGDDSPYIWFKASGSAGSWEMFDRLLHEAQVSSTPGVGFGACGEGYLRFTGFNTRELTLRAIERLDRFFQ